MSMIGKSLAHYMITAQIGKGGMGEVYQAKDQKLGRNVAIKVLPEEFARDTDRVARFQREAKLLASLNHTNIAAIHGLDEADGKHFLVMELIEGDTLADRIKAGVIPVEESLKLALQIAEALEAAHEKGVIHRDLKPANIKVTPEGKVKVLDFGLAKAFAGGQPDSNLSNSPTLSDAATQQGLILGTAAYMSPEQARGKTVDKRTDIWAFGCVLFEMLTAHAAFRGEDVSEILASIIKGETRLELLPANAHPRLRELLRRCFEKDLRKRYQDIGDVRCEIEQIEWNPAMAESFTGDESSSKLRPVVSWMAAAIIVTAIIAGFAGWYLRPSSPSDLRPVTRFYYELPEGQQFADLAERALAISPDGRQFVYSTTDGLYLHSMDQYDAKLIPGTGTEPEKPVFSPDGKWIAYWSGTDNQLKKIPVTGGIPEALPDAASTGFYTWRSDDTIVFGRVGRGVLQITGNGGAAKQIIKVDADEGIISPQILPDGKTVLFTKIVTRPFRIMLQSIDSSERRELFQGDTAEYLPTGHIVYAVDNNLFAVAFDFERLEMTGTPIRIANDVIRVAGAPQYAVCESGTLIYIQGITNAPSQRTLVWVDRNGREEPLAADPDVYSSPSISPDGTKVALNVGNFAIGDIWTWDLIRKTMTRVTSDAANAPLWTPDSKRIAYNSIREGIGKVYWKAADGTGKIELIGSVSGKYIFPSSWSDDGKNLILTEYNISTSGSYDVGLIPAEGDREHKALLEGTYNASQPKISPNGNWMAYTSNESGNNQIYVRPYPAVDSGGRWQISTAGGESPLWSRDGRELFYRNDDAVMAVQVKTDPKFSAETPNVLFRGSYVNSNFAIGGFDLNPWDVSPDGRHFLMIKEVSSPADEHPHRIAVVVNWFEELKKLVPVHVQ